MRYIDLPVPHGFLIWRGKQTAIAMDKPIPADKLLIVSNGEAFGEAVLSKPIATNIKEFDKRLEEHCVKELERRLWWQEAEALFIHNIKSFNKFEEPVLFENGEMVDYKPTAEEQVLINQASELPKTLVLDEEAVVVCGDGQHLISDRVKGLSDIERILEAGIKADGSDNALSVYQLALVRQPRLVVKKKEEQTAEANSITEDETKQEDEPMPYAIAEEGFGDCEQIAVVNTETEEVVEGGCHETMEEAQAHLAALMMAEEEMMSEEAGVDKEEKQEGFDDSEWDGAASNWDTADAYCSDCLIDVNPAGEDKVKDLCFLPYRKPGNENPNLGSLRTMSTGRGLPALEKPESVAVETWDSKVKAAANKLIDWWPDAFEKPAPDSIYEAAGKEPPAEERDLAEKPKQSKAGRRLKTAMLKRLKDAMTTIKDLLSWAEYAGEDKMFETDFGFAIKEINGEPWHFMWSTNAFQDREEEIFSTKALDQFANEVNRREDKGYFNFWHIEGTDFARKEFVETVGRFLIEAGPYLKDEKGQAALEFFKEYEEGHPAFAPEGWGGSPEFRFNLEDRDDGIYDWLWIERTSTLPRAAAANVWTESKQTEVKMSTLEGQRKEAAIALFGEEFVEGLAKEGQKRTADLEEAGVAHKENGKPEEPEKMDLEMALKNVLAEKVEIDLSAITEVVKSLEEKVTSQAAEIQSLKTTAAVKEETETPRYVLSLQTRASEAKQTELADDSALKGKKPAETPTDKTMAGAYFGR